MLKDIKINSMEEKLNKTIDMLNNMQDYLVENRIIARKTSKLIDGRDITDEELQAERIKCSIILYIIVLFNKVFFILLLLQ